MSENTEKDNSSTQEIVAEKPGFFASLFRRNRVPLLGDGKNQKTIVTNTSISSLSTFASIRAKIVQVADKISNVIAGKKEPPTNSFNTVVIGSDTSNEKDDLSQEESKEAVQEAQKNSQIIRPVAVSQKGIINNSVSAKDLRVEHEQAEIAGEEQVDENIEDVDIEDKTDSKKEKIGIEVGKIDTSGVIESQKISENPKENVLKNNQPTPIPKKEKEDAGMEY